MGMGTTQIIIILVVIVLLFGCKKHRKNRKWKNSFYTKPTKKRCKCL